jgi:non-specific serine/threonine protein kinase/serine/threonine-protein kinase
VTTDRWRQVRELFDAVLEQPPENRSAFLDGSTNGDLDLRREVNELLASYDESESILTRPAVEGLESLLDTSQSMEGRRVGPYRLLKKIGSGGMGSVFVAARADQEFEQRVAIKLVRPGMNTRAILQRFLKERQVLAGLDHPNIARLLDGGSTPEGLPYLVMEYVDGTPMDRYADEHQLNVTQRVQLFRTVCDAVQYSHQNLIVHRDLKPANILVTPQGVVKLLDFGIAKLIDAHAVSRVTTGGLTADGTPMTPEYASPEQVLGEPVTTASDVYALGVMLYQFLTGLSPYRLKQWTAPALFSAITQTDPDRPSDVVVREEEIGGPDGKPRNVDPAELAIVREGTPEKLRKRLQGDLDVIILTALRKEPSRRYSSAEKLSDDLRKHIEGHPVSARKDTVAYRVAKFVERHRTGVALTAVLLIGLIASTITSLHYMSRAIREEAVAERRFNDVRQLAKWVLIDFDDTLRAGETPARKVLVSKAIEYLDRLSREAAGDPSLQREVVQGYLKMGTIQGNLYSANVGDSAAAANSYRRALQMAEALVRGNPGNRADEQLLAAAGLSLGDLVALGGDRKEALRHYRRALEILEKQGPATAAAERRIMGAASKIAFVQFSTGDLAGALASYNRSLELAEKWLAVEPASTEARRAVAVGSARSGEILARMGKREEGLERLRYGLSAYQELLKASPENALARRDVAATLLILGDTHSGAGSLLEAIDSYRQALVLFEQLARQDPKNEQYQRDLHVTLGRLGDILPLTGRRDEARLMIQRALAVLKPLVDKESPHGYDIQQYVWLLVTAPFDDLRKPALALPYAKKAVEMTKGSHPGTLDALARAYFGVGEVANAIATEEKALSLLPPLKPGESVSSLRRELQENLARFQAARQK